MLMARLQKERDTCQEEVVSLQERIELQATQVSKAIRDKDSMATELEVIKERWDKAHSLHQKLTVNDFPIYTHTPKLLYFKLMFCTFM